MWSPTRSSWRYPAARATAPNPGIGDVGVIGVESGYEIYIGGNGGIKTEVAQFFCKVRDDDEVLEYAGAFIQLYREEGFYLERTRHYLERVGMDHIRQHVLDDADRRKALYDTLLFALQNYKDPWSTIAQARPGARPKARLRIIKAWSPP